MRKYKLQKKNKKIKKCYNFQAKKKVIKAVKKNKLILRQKRNKMIKKNYFRNIANWISKICLPKNLNKN